MINHRDYHNESEAVHDVNARHQGERIWASPLLFYFPGHIDDDASLPLRPLPGYRLCWVGQMGYRVSLPIEVLLKHDKRACRERAGKAKFGAPGQVDHGACPNNSRGSTGNGQESYVPLPFAVRLPADLLLNITDALFDALHGLLLSS